MPDEGSSAPQGGLRRLPAELRSWTFGAWLYTATLVATLIAVVSALYVSFTSLTYVGERVAGLPANVAPGFALCIDAPLVACVLGQWYLVGRQEPSTLNVFGWLVVGRERAYLIAFGVLFGLLTVGANALHGALALSVQRPIELHIGGQLVALPWFLALIASAVPGGAVVGTAEVLTIVIAVGRRESARSRRPTSARGLESTSAVARSSARVRSRRLVSGKSPDPRVLRLLQERPDATYHDVARAIGVLESRARREITAARKLLRTRTPAPDEEGSGEGEPGEAA
jgi:hypothetical protein